ncbi:MAG TPA: type I glyceraldehyde-3-phosphate dehydrogenase [Candidatus Paceibacterota bacterium]
MATKVAINGCGRIGRAFLKDAIADGELEVVAVNDLADIENVAYLLRHDSAYGESSLQVSADRAAGVLRIDGREVKYLSEKEPEKLPWGELGVDLVIESTGRFTSREKAEAHIKAGAKRVVITAPSKDAEGAPQAATALVGVNEEAIADCPVTSNASCTTNAASPLIAILDEAVGVELALLNTVHAYTASQSLVDAPNAKDWREGRAAAQNVVPSSTGAAIAVTLAYPELAGKFDGISLRVPVITGSIVDVTFVAKRPTTAEEVNAALKAAAASQHWQGIFSATEEPLVSGDIIGSKFASIADLEMTRVVGGTLVKVLAWYDNEAGYTATLLRHVKIACRQL